MLPEHYKRLHKKFLTESMQATKNRIHSQEQTAISMTEFKPITLQDKDIIIPYLLNSQERDCDFSFANLCSWHFMTESSYAIINQQLVIRFLHPEGFHEYFMPWGEGSLLPTIHQLEECARAEHVSLYLKGTMPGMQNKLEQVYPTLFEYSSDRDYFDYIYSRQDLAELKGKHYQPKRNHVNKFNKEYQSVYEPLTPAVIPECLQFESEWCMKHGYIENENIKNERRAMTFALHHFNELNLTGAIIRIEGKIVAFTFGAPITTDTFGIHYEKADISIDGVYSAINQYFASHLPEQYIYLNREEDLGIPGLRQAKLSYHPALLLQKARAVKKIG